MGGTSRRSAFQFISLLFVPFVVMLFLPNLLSAGTRNVAKVHQGDLIEIEGGWVTRLTGIRAPVIDEPFGKEAYDFTCNAVEGKRVALFTWTTNNLTSGIVHDEEGKPFGTILYGEAYAKELNAELLKRGLAKVDSKYLPDDVAETYRKLETEAKDQGIGIWSTKD